MLKRRDAKLDNFPGSAGKHPAETHSRGTTATWRDDDCVHCDVPDETNHEDEAHVVLLDMCPHMLPRRYIRLWPAISSEMPEDKCLPGIEKQISGDFVQMEKEGLVN